MSPEKLVVGLAGMPGAGKSVIVEVAKERGYGIVVMGDEVREEARKRGLNPSPENIGRIMLELRRSEGEAVIARRCLAKIVERPEDRILVDGIRSLAEVEEFKRSFRNFVLLAVHAPPKLRFQRLFNRQRSDDPQSWEIFHERDMRELSVGLGNAIAMADYMIINNGGLEEAKIKAKEVLARIEAEWMR
ncbi:MAG: AAA family ATPase [Candidatus Bathyarchaeia archaeon]|nr:flagellar hook-basal body complex protein FliE [Candidatus Bathyarchaeota archaeon]MBS7659616.1 flagellar hook-basal body complex protein FliE [Candidatus Bathyarchaeota archaeon]